MITFVTAATSALNRPHLLADQNHPAARIAYTLNAWLERYDVIFKRRKLSDNTYKSRKGQIAIVSEKMGAMVLSKNTTRHVAEFLEFWVVQEKHTMATTMRSVLSDIFREAIVEGHIDSNPVTPTRAATVTVKRERLELEQYIAIREAASVERTWHSSVSNILLMVACRSPREKLAP
ncbi:hypothetical protein RDT67_09030 [Serratia fonticola]|uniref:Core-binding (CB) domain-containing protein n=1 Tax=Serratia fonticola TaxID=47917 RepID=A0AAJ1YEL7_SERFO|nr:hypothetical protein [Serratia fonticola]MDQ9126574.1 hypothetical protein [Serratia fonticola]